MKYYLPFLFLLLISLQTAYAQHDIARPWDQDVIYFALTDRFFDGDASNNRPPESDPALYDPTQSDMDLYHGGDFRGLEIALENGYFNALGITAIWITPPLRNVWYAAFDSNDAPKTGYHGYWTQDFLDIDPHLTSARSLDGSSEYPDTRDGRMQHYKDFVALAHSKGIKIIQDIVCNHAGPVFYYDNNQNGHFDRDAKSEWMRPFKDDGFYSTARWASTAKWNQQRTEPNDLVTILGQSIELNGTFGRLDSYGRKGMSANSLAASNGEEVICDFLSLRDFWTHEDSPHFDQLVDDFVAVYAFYLEEIGVDGLRIDTVKHVHHAFWDAFTERLRERLEPGHAKKLILFGEVYSGDPSALGQYTYREDWPEDTSPSLDSMLNFQFCYAVRQYLRTGEVSFGTAQEIETSMRARSAIIPDGKSRPYYNLVPGLDGLNSADKIINFVENHDGINRFRVRGVSEASNFLANALTLTMPGIPCLYYGTEVALSDDHATVQEDAETGRLTYLPAKLADPFNEARQNTNFQRLASLIELRNTLPALHSSSIRSLWIDRDASRDDDGIYAFIRGAKTEDPIIVVCNASPRSAVTAIPGQAMPLVNDQGQPLVKEGQSLEAISMTQLEEDKVARSVAIEWDNSIPHARIPMKAESVALFRIR